MWVSLGAGLSLFVHKCIASTNVCTERGLDVSRCLGSADGRTNLAMVVPFHGMLRASQFPLVWIFGSFL